MRILHAVHDFLPRHRAGSEIYASELAAAQLRQGHEIHVLCAEYDLRRPHGSLTWRYHEGLPVTEVVNNWAFDAFAESYLSPELGRQLDHVLAMVSPDVLHLHNLLNLSFELPALAAARGIPVVATLHDYTLLCPSGGQRVHRAEDHVCQEIDPDRCARCFRQSPYAAQMGVARWTARGSSPRVVGRLSAGFRRRFPRLAVRLAEAAAQPAAPGLVAADIEERLGAVEERVYPHVALFVAPSPALGAEYRRQGIPGRKLVISDYGFPDLGAHPVERPRHPLRLGFVGTLAWHKGAHLLLEALRRLPPKGWSLTLFGSLDTFPDYAARLRVQARGLPVRFAGGFDRGALAAVYEEIDVLVVPSLWPENSPLVIHEAFQGGVPVVGARRGGIADLVEDGVNGILFDLPGTEGLAAAIRALLDAPGRVRRLAAAVPPVKPIARDAKEWEERYRRVAGESVA